MKVFEAAQHSESSAGSTARPHRLTITQAIAQYFLSPPRTDLTVPADASLELIQGRERILTVMIRVAAILGLIAMLQSIPIFAQEGHMELNVIYSVPVVVLWILALNRRIDYGIRAIGFLTLAYALSIIELVTYGDSVESHEYLLAFTILATIFLGIKAGGLAIVSSLVTLGVSDWLLGTGQYRPADTTSIHTQIWPLADLVSAWLIYLMVAGAVNIGLFILMSSLNRAWQREHQTADLLQQERDLLEQRVVERTQALAEARDEALSASRYKTELMAKVNHELRTPLSAILGYTELLHNGLLGPLAPQQHRVTAEVLDSTHHLTSLVGDLLDQAQIERGQIQIHRAPFNPRALVDQVTAILNPIAAAKELRLTIEVATDLPITLIGDQQRLKQILTNLVNNAIKFTETGSVTARLQTHDAEHWTIQVTDTGPGMPEEAQARIFEPFWQADNSITRTTQGYGLGLSIVKELTTLMGGDIQVNSVLGQGSTFTVVLPFAVQAAETLPAAAVSLVRATEESSQS